MKDVEIIGMLKSYVQKSLIGVGALKGAPCKIQSITDGDGFHTVKFEWTDDAGTSHTSDMIVNDGSDIASITQDGATITVELSDGTSHDFIVPTVQGPKGNKGDKGDTGAGVPEGGTAGQVLVKKSSTDYDTKWDTPVGGGDMLKSVYDTDNDGKVDSAENADTVDGHTVAKDVPADAKFTDTVYDDTEIRAEIPSKTSDLTNDSGFITKAVNDLVNYYLKSETYSKTEVDDIVTAIKNSRFEVVATLPTTDIKTNVIYLVPKDPAQTSNVKDEYINLDGTTAGWEKIDDTEIDLSDYVTTQALNTALAAYTTTADLTTLLAGKQDTLTFDNVPTENSNNPVKSGGVYTANDKIYQVMGQNSAKNFIPFDLDRIKAKNTTGTWNGNVYSVNGIDFTFNSDGTVDASGTATETASVHYYDPVGLPPFGGDRILRLTGCPSGGSGTTYKVMAYRAGEVDGSTGTAEEYGDGISLKWLNNGSGIKAFISISVYTGAGTIDVTFKPMLRLSTDTDNTFAPYAKTNQELTAENEALTNQIKGNWSEGGKNLLPNNIYGTTTNNGVTVSRNDDGSLNVSGTNTSDNVISISLSDAVWGSNTKGELWLIDDYLDRTQTYIMSISETDVNVRMRITFYDSSHEAISGTTIDTRTHANITIPSEAVYAIVRLAFSSGQTVSTDTVVYPMIRLASITDDTYEPYAKTNQQLTEDKAEQAEVNDIVNASGSKNVLIHDLNSVYKLWEKEYSNSGSWSGRAWTFVGVTYTFNEDGSVTLSGTSTGTPINMRLAYLEGLSDGATYVLSNKGSTAQEQLKLEIDGTEVASLTGNNTYEFVYDSTKKYRLLLKCTVTGTTHDSTVYPMICLKSIYELDSTYQPPTKTNQQLTEDTTALLDNTEVNGAVNMLPNTATTQTVNGIALTVNDDGSITANGTATALVSLNISGNFSLDGNFKLTGCPSGGGNETYSLRLYDSSSTNLGDDEGDGKIITVNNKTCHAHIIIRSGVTVSDLTFKPMITVPSYNGDYVPYAKSNRELTEELTVESGDITRLVSFSAVSSYGVRKYGKVVELYFAGTLSEAVNTWTDFLTVPEGFRPSHYVQIASFNTYSSCKNLQLAPSGGIQSAINLSSGDFIRFSATYIID